MRQQACLPSMKPFGIALAAKISYLYRGGQKSQLPRFIINWILSLIQMVLRQPLTELLENNSIWKTLPTDSDSLQHTVTPQLLEHQVCIQLSCLKRFNFRILTARTLVYDAKVLA